MTLQIEKNHTVRDKYHGNNLQRRTWDKKGRKSSTVNEVVIHGTAGGQTVDGLLRWMERGERAESYWKSWALFHYAVGKGGDVAEVIDPLYYVYHSQSGRHDVHTVGIELMNSSKTNRDAYTENQYTALTLLLQELCERFSTIERVVSHKYNAIRYSRRHKDCPGDGFDWEHFAGVLQLFGFTFERDNDVIFNLKLKKAPTAEEKKRMENLLKNLNG